MNHKLLTPEEAADLLGVAIGTLSQWRATRRVVLPFVHVGRLVRYRPHDIQRFIESRTVDSEAAAGR